MGPETKQCQNCKADFIIEPDDLGFYAKIGVPIPTFCPECRFQRRLLWRNERAFYHRECDLCQRKIISAYPVGAPFPVYCHKCWWSDSWDPFTYGREYDLSRPFFEQYQELQNVVPALSLMNDDGAGSVNSEWCYDWAFSKNCYLGACGWYVENGAYMYCANYDKDVFDIWDVNNSELVYDGVTCDKCYGLKYCTLCLDCNNCTLGFDLRGCSNCTMCVGLRNKQYCILNQQYSKEEYEERIKDLNLGSRTQLTIHRKEFEDLVLRFPRKYSYQQKCVSSTGHYLIEAKASKNCFYMIGPTENCRYLTIIDRAKDSYDCNNTGNPELCYESVTPDNSRGNKSSVFCWKCTEAEYSNNCHSCVSILGCTALRQGSYTILNKRYSKEEFQILREKIVAEMRQAGEWGEFFPAWLSPFVYNETAALEWFPLTKDQALGRGFVWKDPELKNYAITKHVADLPDTIADIPDAYVNEVIECAHGGNCNERCTQAFRIIPTELQMYRKMDIPLPILCPNCRHYARLTRRNSPRLYRRVCQCGSQTSDIRYQNSGQHAHGESPCPNQFETPYSPERKEIVYCEQCYNAEIA